MHILLLEPDSILGKIYSQALTIAGHSVTIAASAQSAVHCADQKQPDIVVLELQLQRHNGIEFLYEFRSYSEWLHIPIIIHTFIPVSELIADVTLEHELGVKQILYKPATSLATLCSATTRTAAVAI